MGSEKQLFGRRKTYLELLRTQTVILVYKVPESEICGRDLGEYFGEISSSVSHFIIFSRYLDSSCHWQKQDPKLEAL